MRRSSFASAFCLLLALGAHAQRPSPPRQTIRVSDGSYAILRLDVRESGDLPRAAAFRVAIDRQDEQVVVLTPGVGRSEYAALLGPLRAGAHTVDITRSSLWPQDGVLEIARAEIEEVRASDPRAPVLAHAPLVGLRADTIGTSSDVPLLMYVEDDRRGGDGWLRYSMIFSNEDGGTPGIALMARWGRTTDIELIYEVELRGGRVVAARYQGPDHRMLAPASTDTRPPRFVVATLNNMVTDRGVSAAAVRPAPELVQLAERSRETVMDAHPWIYRVMAREIAAERPAGVADPRDFVYVDARIDAVAGAAVAIGARGADGTTWWSDRGRADLGVSRTGEVRIAVPAPAAERLDGVSVRCDPRPVPAADSSAAGCGLLVRQAFRLTDDYRPAPALLTSQRLALSPGMSRDVAIAAASSSR